MRTVGEVLRWRKRQHPDAVAVRSGDQTTTHRELDVAANRVANALLAGGLSPGDRVCVLDKGHGDFMAVVFGIAKAGGVFTPVNWRLAPPEIAYVLNDAMAPFVFVGEAFADAVASVEGELEKVRTIVRWGDGPESWPSYEAFCDGASEDDPRCDRADDETVWQLYTSGTTGHPKGTELTNDNLAQVMVVGATGFGSVRRGDKALVCLPLYHIGGSGYALAMFFAGAELVITRDADPAEILELIEGQGITHAFLVPAVINFLLQQPTCKGTDFSSLSTILYGASPIPEELLKNAIETFACDFVQAYGLTETTGAVALLPPLDHLSGGPRLRACGLPVFGAEVRTVDAHGEDCPIGEVGEIIVRGGMVMRGYWNRADATAEAIRDGWFHSGDAGYFDEDGYLYIHDRVKDMIVSGGENVYPAEVESALFAHEGVADVAVIGVPDERWGEAVKAVVVRKEGSKVSDRDLIDACRGKIAGFKTPRSVDFVDELPRNPTGKVLKRELREKYWAGRDRGVN
jgi:acyl-CoA synthetase (AMP-forming)/AMP-acid ligase II